MAVWPGQGRRPSSPCAAGAAPELQLTDEGLHLGGRQEMELMWCLGIAPRSPCRPDGTARLLSKVPGWLRGRVEYEKAFKDLLRGKEWGYG